MMLLARMLNLPCAALALMLPLELSALAQGEMPAATPQGASRAQPAEPSATPAPAEGAGHAPPPAGGAASPPATPASGVADQANPPGGGGPKPPPERAPVATPTPEKVLPALLKVRSDFKAGIEASVGDLY